MRYGSASGSADAARMKDGVGSGGGCDEREASALLG